MFTNTLQQLNFIYLESQTLPNCDRYTLKDQSVGNEHAKKSALDQADYIGCKQLTLILNRLLDDILNTSDSAKLLDLKVAFFEWMNEELQNEYLDELSEIHGRLCDINFNDRLE
jgi:hypothetical protein